MVIEIIYICTNGYCNYAKAFIESLHNFMPGVKKILRILSNGCEEYKLYRDSDILYTEVIPIFDLYYPCINLNKMYFISQLKSTIADYIFYFDADTICKEVPNYDWNGMIRDMNEGKILVTKHMYYTIGPNAHWEDGSPMVKELQLQNLYDNYTEKDSRFQSYIPQGEYSYIITSFFAGKREYMQAFCEKITLMTRADLRRENGYHIPLFLDENYVNALVYDFEHNIDNGVYFKVGQYCEMGGVDNISNKDIFLIQKNFNSSNKTNRQ